MKHALKKGAFLLRLSFCLFLSGNVPQAQPLETIDKATFEQLNKAAKKGDPEAQYYLACYYYEGNGVAKDDHKAFAWFQKSAAQGFAQAQYNLALCYARGIGTDKNPSAALKWYQKAAERNIAQAQYNLALCYDFAKGVAQDPLIAVRWYQKAADQGYAPAQYNLGCCYETGYGVVQDLEKALEWLQKAAAQGDSDAKEKFERLKHLRIKFELLTNSQTDQIPQDILFNGEPLEAGVIAAMVEGDSSRLEPKKIIDCLHKDTDIEKFSDYKEPGFFGYQYCYKNPENPNDTNRRYDCFWKYLGTGLLNGACVHFINAKCFDDVFFLLKRDGDVVQNVEELFWGREGLGGIEKIWFQNNSIYAEQRASYRDFFIICAKLLDSDPCVLSSSTQIVNTIDALLISYKDKTISCVPNKNLNDDRREWAGTITSRWQDGVYQVVGCSLEKHNREYEVNETALLQKCFVKVAMQYSQTGKLALDKEGMKNFAREILDLYLEQNPEGDKSPSTSESIHWGDFRRRAADLFARAAQEKENQ